MYYDFKESNLVGRLDYFQTFLLYTFHSVTLTWGAKVPSKHL